MIWESWIETIATALGVSTEIGAFIISLLFMITTIIFVLAITKGKSNSAIFYVTYFSLILYTLLGWMPVWTILVLVMLSAGLFSNKMRNWLSGSK